jgi:hypothetical protein
MDIKHVTARSLLAGVLKHISNFFFNFPFYAVANPRYAAGIYFVKLLQINARLTKRILYAHPRTQNPTAIRNYT